ncbi:esterase [Streptomyces netropsis]|uniref:Dienelactone hydrolase n=1 Tax=Streptomyces netropsis TaxID=55404 RepID=A0A7W7LBB6_STRNE|nr:esterase [Streptomyces netropsis]MBB4887094.1 dienelactone hydrolase [Streptomyces netropsis]GGR25353.1 lipase [Streptomyces netropsis]
MPAYERGLKRRAVIAAGALAVTCLLGTTAPEADAREAAGAGRPHGDLPAPTGPYAVGTTARHLVDDGRRDPWRPGSGHREVMVSFWYPAERGHGGRTARHMDERAAAHFGSATGAGPLNYGVPAGKADWAAARTHATVDAPVARGSGKHPVVLYSAGLGDPRTWNTGLVEDLASRGYVVVTVDHTYDSSEVALPGGRLATSVLPELARKPGTDIGAVLRKAMKARVDDTRFVLDTLGNAKRRASLPPGLSNAMDLRRVGMAGHSAGGFTAVQTMHDDRRIRAGIDMDGTLEFPGPGGSGSELGTVARDGLDRPFLLMGTESPDSGDHSRQPSWAALWKNSTGWRGDVTLRGSRHGSLTDASSLLPSLAAQGAVPPETVRDQLGTVRPERAVAATRAYVAAFFDRFLKGRDDHLLDGPSDRFPEMRFAR